MIAAAFAAAGLAAAAVGGLAALRGRGELAGNALWVVLVCGLVLAHVLLGSA